MGTKSREPPPRGEAPTWPILEELPTIVWATDCQLRFTSVLGPGLTALNLRPEHVVGRSLPEFFQTDNADFPTIAVHHRAIRGESAACEQDWAGNTYQVRVDPLQDERGTDRRLHRRGAKRRRTAGASASVLGKTQKELEQRVIDRTARLAQANEQLRHEIKERRQAEELLQKEQRYLRHMLDLQDRDRQMVSYEIHDGLVHNSPRRSCSSPCSAETLNIRPGKSGRRLRADWKCSTSACGKRGS